jgi:hypothetical protein
VSIDNKKLALQFEHWWAEEGSLPPAHGLDHEEHCKIKCKTAWLNGAYCQYNKHLDAIDTEGGSKD